MTNVSSLLPTSHNLLIKMHAVDLQKLFYNFDFCPVQEYDRQ